MALFLAIFIALGTVFKKYYYNGFSEIFIFGFPHYNDPNAALTMPFISNWGNFPRINAEISTPTDAAGMRQCVLEKPSLIARGNGRCYGDASLGERVVSTLHLNKILHFDAENGTIECESGVLLADLLALMVPAGWFFKVTPGIKFITVGGAIAADVHGKNHPTNGCFSNGLRSFDLLRSDGSVVRCSRAEHTDLFWQTCGGMGWTGIVLQACFELRRISSISMRQQVIRAKNVTDLLSLFEQNKTSEYAAAWIDCVGPQSGRGVLFLATHDQTENPTTLQMPILKPRWTVPFFAPARLLNSWTIRAYNTLFWYKNQAKTGIIDMDTYFYPLDRIGHWNRLYGRRGFVQYQCCVPEATAHTALEAVLECIRSSGQAPFLSVLKRHGARPAEAIHSFPIKGYSLALDFPMRATLFDLIARLDNIVWAYGGKIYLAKDSCSAPRMSRIDPASFGDPKFWSLMRSRISTRSKP